MVRHVTDKKNLTLNKSKVETNGDHEYYKMVYGDKNRLMQVIINFLSNSIKFSE